MPPSTSTELGINKTGLPDRLGKDFVGV